VEKAYQQIKDFDRLSFLYLANGSTDKLSKMLKIAEARGDPMSRFHNALYAGDIRGRIAVLREVGLRECARTLSAFCAHFITAEPLAYITAKTNGLHELASEILESTGLTEDDVEDLPTFGASSLKPPPIVTSTTELNWPSVSTGENFFDRALANGKLEGGPDVAYPNGVHDTGVAADSALDAWAKEEERDEIDPEEGGSLMQARALLRIKISWMRRRSLQRWISELELLLVSARRNCGFVTRRSQPELIISLQGHSRLQCRHVSFVILT
jgi:coatomer protein complex subunit alpha (xenin)